MKKKNKVGRPPIKDPKMRKAVCISKEVYQWFIKKGDGNFSKGVELAYKELFLRGQV